MRILTVFLMAATLHGQRILYNQDLDRKGQQAAAAADKLVRDPVAAKEFQNLKTIEKQQIEGALQAGFVAMRTQIQAFGTWENVSRSVCKTLRQSYAGEDVAALAMNAVLLANRAEFDKSCTPEMLRSAKEPHLKALAGLRNKASGGPSERIAKLAAEIQLKTVAFRATAAATSERNARRMASRTRANSAAEATGMATKASVDAAAERMGNVQELLKLAHEIDKNTNTDAAAEALDKIEEGVKEVGALIESAERIWAGYHAVVVDPRSLVPPKEKLAASLLALDADHVKELAAIRAAGAMNLEELRLRLEDCVALLARAGVWYSPKKIESSLTETTEDARVNLIYCLHLAAAGAAVNQTPFTTASLRESISARRYAVRRDAIYNGAYEQALQAAGLRLSSYYGTGVKPGQIAQLLYYLSGTVSLPRLAF